MKTKRNCFKTGLLIVLTLALNYIAQAAGEAAHASGVPAQETGRTNAPIPWDQIGIKAGADYHGDGLVVTPTADGARLHCVFQRLDGEATREGLWLVSTVTNAVADRFQVKAAAIGRTEGKIAAELSAVGKVVVNGQSVNFVRPSLTEEYGVSMDGVRQDFVVTEKPTGAGKLRVRLDVSGAQVTPAAGGAQLVLAKSGRKIVYNRLRVTDATGKELVARMEAGTELAVVANDAGAVYPVRIDPTFSDANWISMGGIPGVNRGINPAVYALLVSGSTLYAGGAFNTAGGVTANNVAKWDGSNWIPLGSGTDTAVFALAVSGSTLYAGGDFSTADGAAANYIAQWNGTNWSALGSGMNNYVYALAVDGSGNLDAGGAFTTAGSIAVTNIAQWNGTNWSALGSGLGVYNPFDFNFVYALAVSGSNLYAGGYFTKAGGVTVNGIGLWNGTNWSALGSGMTQFSHVYALAADGSGNLYAGGDFLKAGTFTVNGIAKWNGTNWNALGSGISSSGGGSAPSVNALALDGSGNVYAGGYFTYAGGVTVNNIAKWNGTNWSAMGSGFTSQVPALAMLGGNLYVGGAFSTAGTNTVNYIAQWNGGSWNALGKVGLYNNSVFPPAVYALAVSGSTVYAGGTFTMAGGIAATNIAQWNGSSWSALGSGMIPFNGGGQGGQNSFSVSALAVSGSTLYAGGRFSITSNTNANYIAQWNGSGWSALGSGMNSTVSALAVSGGILYAGGNFTTAGGIVASNIAQWNGSSWSTNGSGINGAVSALAVSGSTLYAGGSFTKAGGIAATNIAQWNGSSWSALGLGMNNSVYSVAISGNTLYAGGAFSIAGNSNANFIAQWKSGS